MQRENSVEGESEESKAGYVQSGRLSACSVALNRERVAQKKSQGNKEKQQLKKDTRVEAGWMLITALCRQG